MMELISDKKAIREMNNRELTSDLWKLKSGYDTAKKRLDAFSELLTDTQEFAELCHEVQNQAMYDHTLDSMSQIQDFTVGDIELSALRRIVRYNKEMRKMLVILRTKVHTCIYESIRKECENDSL